MSKHYFYGVFCMRDVGTPCNNGEAVELSQEEYRKQMLAPNKTWRCPQCGAEAEWDDDSGVCNG